MRPTESNYLAILATLAVLITSPARTQAQGMGAPLTGAANQMMPLSGEQQSMATSAMCSALASNNTDPRSASPSVLSNPSVMSTAASTFSGGMHISTDTAMQVLKQFVAQHSTDILSSCAASSATGALPSGMPGASHLPQMPKMP